MRSPNENNRNRQSQQNNRRGRHNNNRRNNNNNNNGGKPQNMLTRNFDSTGPDVKIRGNAQTIADKYTSLAQDAISSGSRIMAENYFQHAEHYKRIVSVAQEQQAEQKAAHQAKMDAQQAQQTAQREQREAQQAAQREQQAEANANQANAQAEQSQNSNAPVNILDDAETSTQPQTEQPSDAQTSDSEAAPAAEDKPKRKRVTRPKRKPAATSETIDALSNALSNDTPDTEDVAEAADTTD